MWHEHVGILDRNDPLLEIAGVNMRPNVDPVGSEIGVEARPVPLAHAAGEAEDLSVQLIESRIVHAAEGHHVSSVRSDLDEEHIDHPSPVLVRIAVLQRFVQGFRLRVQAVDL